MAAPAKQQSRWGSFLQQALDGVESRLDNILVGDGPLEPTVVPPVAASAATAKPENGSPRSSSNTNSANDRLQERLARAIAAKKYAVQRPDSYASPSTMPSRSGSPATTAETPRRSLDTLSVGSEDALRDSNQKESGNESTQAETSELGARSAPSTVNIKGLANGLPPKIRSKESPRLSIESDSSSPLRQSTDSPQRTGEIKAADLQSETASEGLVSGQTGLNRTEDDALGRLQQKALEMSDLQRQEEIHGYIERIDALQAKLQYLSRESAESARKAAAIASPGTAEKKLAEKDEQIALLMEEGQKLSKTELKHMTVIKKLRAKASETEKENAEAKKRLEKAEKEKTALLERLKRVEATERQSIEKQKTLVQLQKDIEAITAERDVKNSAIAELKTQLLESTSQAKANEVKAAQDLLAQEKRRVGELENDICSLKIEKELAAGRAKAQLEELRARSEREAERARVAEVEMKAEQQMLESRLELMRTRAEEVSSGATGDAQAKLLRQIETLQTQYAVATENWQGIEASLTARVTTLEKERDEALKRETDVRRKAREMTLKLKHNEEELEDARIKIDRLKLELAEQKGQLDRLQRRAEKAETDLIETKKALDQDKQAWRAEMQHRIDEDRTKWREDLAGHSPFDHGRAESPAPSSHKNLTADLLGLQNIQTRTTTRSFTNELPTMESRASRKSSAQRVRSSGQGTPQGQDSAQSYPNGEASETPSIHAVDHDEYFEAPLSPSPTHQTMQDMLSVSTVGPGPSVQLIERMSAAVRRLESEKVSTKEELKRLSAQRDEARDQIVTLMQEVQAKRDLNSRVHELEEENKKINSRYQTTLEMLGEKSELVEELRADVQDVKDMYRELVERTVR